MDKGLLNEFIKSIIIPSTIAFIILVSFHFLLIEKLYRDAIKCWGAEKILQIEKNAELMNLSHNIIFSFMHHMSLGIVALTEKSIHIRPMLLKSLELCIDWNQIQTIGAKTFKKSCAFTICYITQFGKVAMLIFTVHGGNEWIEIIKSKCPGESGTIHRPQSGGDKNNA